MNFKIAWCSLSLICCLFSFSQSSNSASFEYFGPYKVFINGNTLLKPKKQKSALDNTLKNEDVTLYHVDADKEKKTFSSSSTSVNIPENVEIEKAMVIWACNYNLCFIDEEKGKKLDKIPLEKKDENALKLKMPFYNDYITIEPETLVDNSMSTSIFASNLYDPSVFTLDITQMLKNQDNVNGEYWLANYNTIQGQTFEGLSGGWSILIIYKDPNLENSLISGSIGYIEISSNSTALLNFPNKKNNVNTKNQIPFSLSMFTLGGDPNEGNERFFWSNDTYKNVPITFENRDESDFLKSAIDNFGGRQPRLKNNFGVDLFNVESYIPANFFQTNNQIQIGIDSDNDSEKMQVIYSVIEIPVPKALEPINNNDFNIDSASQNQITFDKDSDVKEEDEFVIRSYKVPTMESGYYLVNGVFAKQRNRINWIKHLKKISEYSVNYFHNPTNKYDYIFCHYTKDLVEAKVKVADMRKKGDFEESWILEVTK